MARGTNNTIIIRAIKTTSFFIDILLREMFGYSTITIHYNA
jgi:hypothetical protein